MKPRLSLLGLLTIIAVTIVAFIDPIAQNPGYHGFADKNVFADIPNFLNVISNLPFVIIGIYGLTLVAKAKPLQSFAIMYSILFAGIIFTGFGSGYYHYHPDSNTLVFDRLPMTLVFMSFLSATISECINVKAGIRVLFPLLILGIVSVLWWHHTEVIGNGDLRFYGLVQFYPVIFIPLILLLFPSAEYNKGTRLFIWIIVWYVIAKIFEEYDKEIFNLTGIVSGHSLKHLAASVSTWYIALIFKRKFC